MQNTAEKQTKSIFKSFALFFEGENSVAFAMGVGILFLFTAYQNAIHFINPHNSQEFIYAEILRICISHIDSFFFAFTTCIIIFQSKNEGVKILFCVFESSFLFLSFGRKKLEVFGFSEEKVMVFLIIYIAVFSGFAFYFLGSLAKMHRQKEKDEHKENQTAPLDAPPTQVPSTKKTRKVSPNTQKIQRFAGMARQKTKIGFPLPTPTPPTKVNVDTLPKNLIKDLINDIDDNTTTNKGGRNTVITPEITKTVLELKDQKSLREIGKETGISHITVKNIVEKEKQKSTESKENTQGLIF